MKRGFLFSCLAMLLAACATSPTGRTQFMMFSEATAIASSKQAYAQLLAPLSKEGKIDTDALLRDRVMGMTSRVVAQAVRMRPETANWEWEIKIINDPKTVNAVGDGGWQDGVVHGLGRATQTQRRRTRASHWTRDRPRARQTLGGKNVDRCRHQSGYNGGCHRVGPKSDRDDGRGTDCGRRLNLAKQPHHGK